MKILEVLNECQEVYVDENGEVLSEAAVRQYKRLDQKIVKRYRCLAGPKKGKLVANPAGCATRKEPKKVRSGRKVMRAKKGLIQRKSRISKRKMMSKMVAKMNARLMGKI